jgi:outer membrane protein OmpA-like peptidoglycan-associated protein
VRRPAIAVGLVALAVAAPAAAQNASDPGSRIIDVQRRVVDVLYRVEEAPGETTVESGSQAQLILAADVLFAFDKADLTPAASQALQVAAGHVKAEAKGPVHIDGYTDAVGDSAYNVDLSRRRAAAVEAALGPLVGKPVQFVTAGHGAADPVAPNTKPDGSDNPDGRAQNRRVTVGYSK